MKIGDTVVLLDLKYNQELNSTLGIIMGKWTDGKRWMVKLDKTSEVEILKQYFYSNVSLI